MTDSLLLGVGRHMIPIPRMVWGRLMKARVRKIRTSLGFMSEDHHRVRDFAVTELPRAGAPLSPESIAEALGLAVPQVRSLLTELEEHLTLPVQKRPGRGDLGLSGDGRRNATSRQLQHRRGGVFALSCRRLRHALRARAPSERVARGHHPDGMLPLLSSHAVRGGLSTRLPRRGRGRSTGLRPARGVREAERPEHHRRLLTEVGILLVRRTRQGASPQGRRRPRHVSDPEPDGCRHSDHAGRVVRVSAEMTREDHSDPFEERRRNRSTQFSTSPSTARREGR